MNNSKLHILFVLDKVNTNVKGIAPLRCKLTYLSKRKVFSLGLFINPDYRNNREQKAKPQNQENNFVNTQISLIKQKINQAFLFLQVQETIFDVEDIYLKYKGKDSKVSKTLLEVFDLHNERMQKLIGKEYTQSTYNKFKEARSHIKNFIKHQYNKNNFLLEDINLKFLKDFDYYLKINKNQKQITINKSIQRVKKIIKLAIAEGFITIDPFLLYKPKRVENKVLYLTTEELKKLENYTFSQTRLQQVADMFIFCCYTGLAYQEMSTLESKHIIQGFDGNKWIRMYRRNTQREISIPLLPISTNIIEKYNSDITTYLLPKISNQKFNSYLKEIADIVGINKNLTHHIARKHLQLQCCFTMMFLWRQFLSYQDIQKFPLPKSIMQKWFRRR